MELADRVLAAVRKHGLVPSRGRVLVALSGGPDSVGLFHLLRELERAGHLTVVGVAHVNHGLRAAAAEDEAFCRAVATAAGVPYRSETVDVRGLARSAHTSIEDAGRRARYASFEVVADELNADVIATGHTRDDQAETFLLRLLRGSGLRGLSAILPKRGRVIRPLIDVGRSELREWLYRRGHAFREDESNSDVAFERNRVRHVLMPLLAQEFSPSVVEVLAREAAIAREDDDRLEKEAIELARSVVLLKDGPHSRPAPFGGSSRPPDGAPPEPAVSAVQPEAVFVDTAALVSLHPALACRIARLALTVLAPERFVGFEHVARLLQLAAEGGAVSLPGQHATRDANRIVIRREPVAGFANSFSIPLSIPGEVLLPAQGWAVSADWQRHGGETAQISQAAADSSGDDEQRLRAVVTPERLSLPLAVRSRRRGDRFRPPGLGGRSRKLQDILVDRKVPRELRDALPLVVDSADRIVWIVGESVGEDFRVTGPSQGVILLKARRLGGLG